ncbi:hypothetical protein B0J18DRAFT_472639 [Chaetomium sp. MPI-SDFR-AT-0129]|nr:hypothetical protein B0J18DRAFT_472639 [Chaetomium sp. MPI-SDFR-AT-0129]
MDSEDLDGRGARDAGRLRKSVSMALRQLRQPQHTRPQSAEIPESDEEVERNVGGGGDSEVNDEDGEEDDGEEEENDGEDDDEEDEEADERDDGEGSDDGNKDGIDDSGDGEEEQEQEEEEEQDNDINSPPNPHRRNSVSSAGSHYSPPSSASEEEAPRPRSKPASNQSTPKRQSQLKLKLQTNPRRSISASPFSTVPPTPSQPWPGSPRKRARLDRDEFSDEDNEDYDYDSNPNLTSPPPQHPRKRHRPTAPVSYAYLALLNEDIIDAAQRFAPYDWDVNAPPTTPATTTATAHDDDTDPATTHPRPRSRRRNPSSHRPGPGRPRNDEYTSHTGSGSGLGPSQVGLTHWSEAEKVLFFEALTRVGGGIRVGDGGVGDMDRAAAIAERMGLGGGSRKSALEVGAYWDLLRGVSSTSSSSGFGFGSGIDPEKEKEKGLQPVLPADLPAAIELSPACCTALEDAADALATRQETYEEGVEKRRWGDEYWLIGRWNVRAVEGAVRSSGSLAGSSTGFSGAGSSATGSSNKPPALPPSLTPPLELFRIGTWLQLSERVFMNSTVEEYNWATATADNAGETPSIRATALIDLYSLTVEITRRLVAATVWVAESRVRTRRGLYPDARSRVWKEDVRAAALSVGLGGGVGERRRFWGGCARRLRLGVVRDEEETGEGREMGEEVGEEVGEGEEILSYDEVERALGMEVADHDPAEEDMDQYSSSDAMDMDMDTDININMETDLTTEPNTDFNSDTDTGSIDLGNPNPNSNPNPKHTKPKDKPPEKIEKDSERITLELNEALIHSALDYPTTGKPRTTLRNRIRVEHAQEAYADRLDMRAAYREEKRLWGVLGREVPEGVLVKPQEEEDGPREGEEEGDREKGVSGGLGMGGRSVVDVLGGWERPVKKERGDVGSRWEMEYALARKEGGQEL